jgi:protein involved in polysaccharide export with SLBB domain
MRYVAQLFVVAFALVGTALVTPAQETRSPNVDSPRKCFAVIGAVRAPGRFELKRRVRLTEVLAFAGGFTERAGATVQIMPAGARCTEEPRDPGASPATEPKVRIYRIDDINTTDETRNPYLDAGDIVVVNEADCVYIIGSVVQPRQMVLKGRVTLTQAIAFAGGELKDAKVDRVSIIRQTTSSGERLELKLDLNKIRKKRAEDPVLQPNDIIKVPFRHRPTGSPGIVPTPATQPPVRVIY